MNEIETWKPIPGYEGIYSVSDHGRVRGERRQVPGKMGSIRTLPQKVLSSTPDSDGYLQLTLRKDGIGRTFKASGLVAMAFIGPRPDRDIEVAHGDGDHTNNRLGNLRYATRVGNAADKVLHGRTTRGERSGMAKLTQEQVLAIRADTGSHRSIAREYGVSHRVVWGIKHREGWAWLP